MAVDEDLQENVRAEAKLICAINSAQTSAEHLVRFQQVIESTSKEHFAQEPNVLESVPKPLSDIARDFESMVSNGLHHLLHETSSLAQDWLELIQKHVSPAKYDINVTEFHKCEVQGSALLTVVQLMLRHPVLRRCQVSLGPLAFGTFLKNVLDVVTVELDTLLRQKTFSEWGAMLVEKEIRVFLSAVTKLVAQSSQEMAGMSLRAQFTQLHELVHELITETHT